MAKPVFVFGSNLRGLHGGGAAHAALNEHGAVWGKGSGHYGDSYAIPTKGNELSLRPRGQLAQWSVGKTLDIEVIRPFTVVFFLYAQHHPDLRFDVTRLGCGLAGLKDEEVAPMFLEASKLLNVYFDSKWASYLDKHAQFWGSFP